MANDKRKPEGAAGVGEAAVMQRSVGGGPRPEHQDPETPRVHYLRQRPGEPTLSQEIPNMILLILLYMIQGVPLGLTFGAMPLLLSSRTSLTQIGIFSIAAYPYSFKLFWSPVVDAVYSPSFGRRKSWIVPIQLISAAVMFWGAPSADRFVQDANVEAATAVFFVLVLLAATQDIAVDGWALELLSPRYVGYAATCQTLGMNFGYFTSFTIFMALNDPDFCNRYLRAAGAAEPRGLWSLEGYLKFWAAFYVLMTAAVHFLGKPERKPKRMRAQESSWLSEDEFVREMGIGESFSQLWAVVRLPAVMKLTAVLVCCRLAFLPAEAAAPLKLMEKGVSKEMLASLVVLQFPVELLSAVLAGRWAADGSPFHPWTIGYVLRLLTSFGLVTLVAAFPAAGGPGGAHPLPFLALALLLMVTSFSSTLMFTAMGTFYNHISDPDMGGAYLTLLNTVANFGITVPKVALFAMIDWLSYHECELGEFQDSEPGLQCPRDTGAAQRSNACIDAGGVCNKVSDGFYIVSGVSLLVGVALLFHFMRVLPVLYALPLEHWRVKWRQQ